MLKGSIVAIVTPMHQDGSVDFAALKSLVDWHLQAKTNGLVVVGTTGEAVTLSMKEQREIIETVVNQVQGRIPVIAGTGSNSTAHTIELTAQAQKAGANAVLIVTPYYNKPTQNGLYAHYKAVTDAIEIPIILYNVPGRTACDLLPETVARLAALPNIIGIKEATGKIERVEEIAKSCGNHFAIYSGDDESALSAMMKGAHGVISVTANVAPEKMHAMCLAVLNGDKDAATELNNVLMPLHKKLFLESNPIPTKWALAEMGKMPGGIRLPLVPLDAKFHADLKDAMRTAGVI